MASKIIGIMIDHGDRKEYWTPELSEEDQNTIYQVLTKYDSDEEFWHSIEGDLVVVDQDE